MYVPGWVWVHCRKILHGLTRLSPVVNQRSWPRVHFVSQPRPTSLPSLSRSSSGAANDEFVPRQSAIDTDMEKAALVMVMVRRIDDYVTGGDPIKHAFEPVGPLADAGFEGRRRLHVTKGDLHGVEHDGELPTICGIYFRLCQAVADAGIESPSSSEKLSRTPLNEILRLITSNKVRDVPSRGGRWLRLG
jgi:hypothetical protein